MYDIDSMFSNAKKINGFLNPKRIPVERKKRYPIYQIPLDQNNGNGMTKE